MNNTQRNIMQKVYSLSAWSFIMVLSTMLFTFVGLKMDSWFGTSPMFMIGWLLLCVGVSIIRLYKQATK